MRILYDFVYVCIYIHIFASRLTKTFKRSVWFSLVWSGFSLKKRKETRATSSMLVTFTVFKTENFKANNFESRNKLLLRPRSPNSRFDTARQKSRFYFWHFLRPSFSVQISNFYIFTLFSSFFRYFSSSFAIAIRGQDYFYPILNQQWDHPLVRNSRCVTITVRIFYDPEYKLYVAIIRCSYERKSGTKVTQTMESLNVICIVERREKQVRVHRLRNRDKISSRLFVSLFLGQFHVPKFERNYSFQFSPFVNY